jgi:undecaprenyl-diphosphatase
MSLIYITALALIQGLTEFLPVSSSGHLALMHSIIDFPDQGVLVDVALHGGTLLAVMAYFHKDLWRMLSGLLDLLRRKKSAEAALAMMIIIATLPVIIAGGLLVLSGYADILRTPHVIALASIGFAIPLYFADRMTARLVIDELTLKSAALIGLAQVCALIPGASRSGVTITAGRACGLDRAEAARFSMLLAIPVITLFALAGLIDLYRAPSTELFSAALTGTALAAVVAFLTIHVFLKLTARFSYTPFVAYRIALGVVILLTL